MLTNDHLQQAVKDGVISAEQAAKLRAIAVPDQPVIPEPDEERFRFLGGFNDVFVTIGLFLLIGALYGFTTSYGSPREISILSVVIAWALSEIFARRLKLALPSIVLAIMFAGSALLALALSLNFEDIFSTALQGHTGGWQIVTICLGTALAAALHLWRFKVPIDGALIALSLIGAVFGGVILTLGDYRVGDLFYYILFASGVAVFIAAMRFDISDRERLTRRSDMAFWLHLTAAPLLIHPVIALTFNDVKNINVTQAVVILVLFALLALFALIIDRRAILVSALSYAGIALGLLIERTASTNATVPITLLVLALIVLSLSAGWRGLRRGTVNALPLGGLRSYIPPVAQAA